MSNTDSVQMSGSSSSASVRHDNASSAPPSTIPDVHATGNPTDAGVPLTFVASPAASARLAGPDKVRDMASQSEIQFDPSQPLPEGKFMWKQAYDLVRLLR